MYESAYINELSEKKVKAQLYWKQSKLLTMLIFIKTSADMCMKVLN